MQAAPSSLQRLAQSPRIYVHDDFASAEVIRHVLERYGSREALDTRGIEWASDETGLSGELPIDDDPVLVQLAERIEATLGFRCVLADRTFRFRRYALGDFHPLHVDRYIIAGAHLVATVLVYL